MQQAAADSQGTFRVKRHGDGRIWIEMPPIVIVPREVAITMARAILQMAGAELIVTEPGGVTVVRRNGQGVLR